MIFLELLINFIYNQRVTGVKMNVDYGGKTLKEFSERTLKSINENGDYYVYGLVDPRNDKIFYIGKGTGNRVFQHVAETKKNPESEKEKLQTIKNIENDGYQVKHIIINFGLTEKEALASEASLINLMEYSSADSLKNIVAGHHSVGCLSAEEIEKKYGAEFLLPEDIKHKILVIKVNKLYNRHMSDREIYDIVRGVWRASITRASKVEYVLGVYHNLVVGCYRPEKWYRISDCPLERIPEHMKEKDLNDFQNRVFFESVDIDNIDDNKKIYLDKSLEKIDYIQRSQYPLRYIGV